MTEPKSIDLVILEEETKMAQEKIRKSFRKQEHRGIKTVANYLAGTLLTGALVVGELVGINYAFNEQSYTMYD